ncbi:MAG: hypothetical protein AYK19_13190 [Theionarchaea archaeon DG-70-1]|nr:MAG: hypothetical protein AYK19_13190 [Theionarchaea archaeon DG-70-1]
METLPSVIQTDYKKLEQVLHYIIHHVGGLPHVGEPVLHKLLYFCDFDYYEMYEEPLTGEQYRKLELGPAPIDFDNTIQSLETQSKIVKLEVHYHGHPQEKFISLDEPDVSLLSARQLEVINETLERLSSMNATQISAFSHQDMPWKATEDKEIIDYELVFYRDPLTSVREYE